MTPFLIGTLTFLGIARSIDVAKADDSVAAPPVAAPAPAPPAAPAPTSAPVQPAPPLPSFGPAPPPVPPAAIPGTETWPDFIPLRDAEGRDLSPYGYRQTRKLNRRLIGVGAGVFGGAYLGAVAFGRLESDLGAASNAGWLFVPVLGPAIWGVTESSDTATGELVVLDTAAQAAGVVFLVLGLNGRDGWERKPGYLLVPTASAGRAGVVATGSF